jgi:hypothetical protein
MSDSATETAKGIMRSMNKVLDIPADQAQAAVNIVTHRIAAFLTEDEYADARECLRLKTIHPNYIMALIVADAIHEAAKLPGVNARRAVA